MRPKVGFAPDSLVEGDGFEPSVPREVEQISSPPAFNHRLPALLLRAVTGITSPGEKFKLIGAKQRLQLSTSGRSAPSRKNAGRTGDLAMFNRAVDSNSEDVTSSA
jgi:hypothetical protein